MSASRDSTGITHSIQKFLLIRARVLTRKFYFDVDGPSIRNAVTHDIGLAMMTDVDDTAVFRNELTHRVISSDAAVLAESYDYLVL